MRKRDDKSAGDYYLKSWKYVEDSRSFIYLVMGLFVFSTLVGIFIPVPSSLEGKILDYISELLSMIRGMSHFDLISFIFFNNLKSSFFGVILGIFLGIFSLMSSLINGFVLGFVLSKSIVVEGPLTILRLVPHGIFELPALFISLGMGAKLGLWLIIEPVRFYWKSNKLISLSFILLYLPTMIFTLIFDNKFKKKMNLSFAQFRKNFISSLVVFFLIVVPLLLIAAIIEGSFIFSSK
ncbi:MAG: stage II sporulation protein M [Nanoarchaeota archaeon]|nr:stage II sporulation protein M [Nanoarchaeota archaeon]